MSTTGLNIRWMIRRDMPAVYDIENRSFEFPWPESEFVRVLRQRNCIGMVIEEKERITGYMIYELHHTRLHLLTLAVHPEDRRIGIGSAMVDKLIKKLSHQRRTRITLEIRESNLSGQQFFRALGFRAVKVVRDHYEGFSTEDAYQFQYRLPARVPT